MDILRKIIYAASTSFILAPIPNEWVLGKDYSESDSEDDITCSV
jgi:hypothetical protein